MSHVSFCGEKVRDDVIQCFSQGMTQLVVDRTTKQAAISHLFRDSKTQTLHDVAFIYQECFTHRQFSFRYTHISIYKDYEGSTSVF